MRMTESKLRRIIRQVIAEENIVKLSRGNVDLDKRGKEITASEANKFMEDFKRLKGFKKADERVTDRLIELLEGSQGSTNEVVIAPSNREDYEWALENEPNALTPMCIFENKDYNEGVNVIIHRTVDAKKYYMIRLDGESFPEHQFVDPNRSRPVDPDLRHMKRPKTSTDRAAAQEEYRRREEYWREKDAAAKRYEEEHWWKH